MKDKFYICGPENPYLRIIKTIEGTPYEYAAFLEGKLIHKTPFHMYIFKNIKEMRRTGFKLIPISKEDLLLHYPDLI